MCGTTWKSQIVGSGTLLTSRILKERGQSHNAPSPYNLGVIRGKPPKVSNPCGILLSRYKKTSILKLSPLGDSAWYLPVCLSLYSLILSAAQSPEASWSNVVGYAHAVPNPAQGHQCNLLEADFWPGTTVRLARHPAKDHRYSSRPASYQGRLYCEVRASRDNRG